MYKTYVLQKSAPNQMDKKHYVEKGAEKMANLFEKLKLVEHKVYQDDVARKYDKHTATNYKQFEGQ